MLHVPFYRGVAVPTSVYSRRSLPSPLLAAWSYSQPLSAVSVKPRVVVVSEGL